MTFERLSALIDKEIGRLQFNSRPENLYEPMAYMLGLGGKRIRPLLVLLGYSLFKNDPEKITKSALAVEVFHNFTLMHDDILDKAPLRRGQPSVHEKWNESTAILSGDTMMIRAYELLENVAPEYLPSALRLFNQCAVEVCEGQQMDMNYEQQEEVSEQEYLEMIRLKTAVLLGFSLQLGGLLAGANEKSQLQLRELGIYLGMAFQLMDDHLDTFGNTGTFGKHIGGDILANKKTLLLISALALSNSENQARLADWLRQITFNDQDKIDGVKSIYKECGVEKISHEKIQSYESHALGVLKSLDGDESIKDMIEKYLYKLKQRVE
ncbi:MAG: polyprenyl synthetase family protein [Cytophagales bacterium]|nr:polyprenyl synthetase family protein [Cytophagales bacterium]